MTIQAKVYFKPTKRAIQAAPSVIADITNPYLDLVRSESGFCSEERCARTLPFKE
jgi:hypothetical protein